MPPFLCAFAHALRLKPMDHSKGHTLTGNECVSADCTRFVAGVPRSLYSQHKVMLQYSIASKMCDIHGLQAIITIRHYTAPTSRRGLSLMDIRHKGQSVNYGLCCHIKW